MTGELRPRWLRRVNDAMDLPLEQARQVLGEVLAERRQHAAELRELAARGDVTDTRRQAYVGMAEWVDDSVGLVEQAAARLAELDVAGRVTTGREQINRERHTAGQRFDRADGEPAPPATTCDAIDAATSRRCSRPGVLWRAVRGRPAIEAADWRVCREVHAAGPITVRGRSYDDDELTRPRGHEQAVTDTDAQALAADRTGSHDRGHGCGDQAGRGWSL